jgi:glycosyltransferase involved in cell wall biosynthesis
LRLEVSSGIHTAHTAEVTEEMRACMLAYAEYDNDTRIVRYARALVSRGDSVEVIALRQPGQKRREMVNGVSVLRIQEREPNDGRRLFYLAGVFLFLIRASILLSVRHLRKRYHLVHVHSVPDFLVFGAWLPRLTGAKIILDIHDLLPEFYASRYAAKGKSLPFRVLVLEERFSTAFSHHVIAANDLWLDRLTSRSVKKGHCTSLVNVPERSEFSPQPHVRTDGKFVMLYPGSLNWHQGLDIAIRAFARIKDEAPEAEFHIYGKGSCRASLIQLVNHLGLNDRVFIRGTLTTEEVARAMANSDLGVVPKRKDGFGNEAFSTKIMEFMSVGVPVVVSDTLVDRHYFNDSIVKFFRGGDDQDLAKNILLLIRDLELRRKLARNALAFVERNNWEMKKAEYLALVDSLVHPNRARHPVTERVTSRRPFSA